MKKRVRLLEFSVLVIFVSVFVVNLNHDFSTIATLPGTMAQPNPTVTVSHPAGGSNQAMPLNADAPSMNGSLGRFYNAFNYGSNDSVLFADVFTQTSR